MNGEPTCFDENHNLKKLILIMLDKEAGGALDNLQRRYERDQDAIRDKIERGQQYMNE